MSKYINKILAKTIGLNLKRINSRRVTKNKIKPIYVEFLGASGVGKTTLFQNTFYQIKNKWLHSSEFSKLFSNYIDGKATESLPIYQELAQQKINSVVFRNFSGIDQMNLIKYFYSVLIDDSLIYLFNKNYNVISEDGLLHNFSDCLYPLYKSNKEELESIIKHRAIVYCYTSAEILAGRILEREKNTGQLRPQHKKVNSFDELVSLQKKSLNQKSELLDFLSKYDIPVLSIDTSNPMVENVKSVKTYLANLTNNRESDDLF